jgi:protein SCO1/2
MLKGRLWPHRWGHILKLTFILFCIFLNACHESPEAIKNVGPWSFQTQYSSEILTHEKLSGKVYLANFIFTRCPSICPELSAKTQAFLKEWGTDERIVWLSFSVDPKHDSPAVLRKYADLYPAPIKWFFLTHPDPDVLYQFIKKSLLIPVQDSSAQNTLENSLIDIAHSEKIVLVDKSGQIRGYYSYTNEELSKLKKDLKSLL